MGSPAEPNADDHEGGAAVPDDSAPAHAPAGAPSRAALLAVVIPLIGLVIASYVGNYAGVGLIEDEPVLVIALTSQIRWLILASNSVDPVTFFVVGLLRNLASDPLFYLLGFWYGDSAVRWMESRTQTLGELLRMLEQAFAKWGKPLVMIAPNNPICLLAGASRMPFGQFLALNIVGTMGRLALIRILGEAFNTPIDWVLDFFSEYRFILLPISLAIGGIMVWREFSSSTSEIQQLRQLEDELDEAPTGDRPPEEEAE